MIEVVRPPPFATIQDLGWATGRAAGIPAGGAMDPVLLGAANRLVGNRRGAAAIEWALGPGTLRALVAVTLGVLRGAELRWNGELHEGDLVALAAGDTLEIRPGPVERFLYVAVAGGVAVPELLGSRSTYLPAGLGGHEGRRLRAGDRLPLGGEDGLPPARAGIPPPSDPVSDVVLRVTEGPQWACFSPEERARFLGGRYVVSAAGDRMGYRLLGSAVRPVGLASLPSEGACPGAVQIPDGGEPIVLMPDGPTVGGYPKLVVVIRADLRLLAQCLPGRGVRFRRVAPDEAREALRVQARPSDGP